MGKKINGKGTKFIVTEHWLKGIVLSGTGKGKGLGFPTINLKAISMVDFPFGVYLAKVVINKHHYFGLTHFGPKPTFNLPKSIEIHILKENININLQTQVFFKIIKFIRPIKKFASVDELVSQLKKDQKKATQLLNSIRNNYNKFNEP